MTRTERIPDLIAERARKQGISPEAVEKQMSEANLVRHMIDAREVAYVVAFLASPKSVAITGDVIAAGGGVGKAIFY
jgi:enoyl-[acyl-carrier-protein] reductase (NADH)